MSTNIKEIPTDCIHVIKKEKKLIIDSQNLKISDVRSYPKLLIFKASISQLMLQINFLGIKEPKNVFQMNFDRIFLKDRAKKFVATYENILKCETVEERDVKLYNLIGPLPNGLKITQNILKNNSKIVNRAKIGDLIKALYQRVTFIVQRPMPKFYEDNPAHKKYFLKMQQEIQEFKEEIEKFEEDFQKTIDLCKKLQNVSEYKSY